MDPVTALMLVDLGTNVIFDIAKKIKELRTNPEAITDEEVTALIAKWQPLVDSIADDIQKL